MKSFHKLFIALFIFPSSIAMDVKPSLSIDDKKWHLSQEFFLPEKPLSSCFDKLSRLIVATSNNIGIFNVQFTQLPQRSIYSAYSIHKGHFVAYSQLQPIG